MITTVITIIVIINFLLVLTLILSPPGDNICQDICSQIVGREVRIYESSKLFNYVMQCDVNLYFVSDAFLPSSESL